jgi:hypothetical protein
VRVAATDDWLDPDLHRLPAGEVHAWLRGRNATVCGLQLSRSRLRTFGEVRWDDVLPESGGMADQVQAVCRRCDSAVRPPRTRRRWSRDDPRP